MIRPAITSVLALLLFTHSLSGQEATSPETKSEKKDEKNFQDKVVEKANKVADKIDKDERAKLASAGILKPIYQLAQYFSFSAFHWVAFTLMAIGVVSFALQLVISKLILLARLQFSMTQVLVDLLGLVISSVGLVLTTQAATDNSKFTQSPAAVLSASAVGLVVGFVFFLWSHRQEAIAAQLAHKR